MKREVAVANDVAGGNLSMQINPQTTADQLGFAFKLMVDSNNKTLGNIKESAYQVGAGAQQVAIASQSLAQGSTQQASAIEQVTASITEVTSRTKQNAEEAKEAHETGERVILVRLETSPEDIEGMHAAEGILTVRGGMTSHAAVVARGMGTACISGCGDIVIDEKKNYIGGMIYPGVNISLNALTENASQLQGIGLEAPKRIVGKNTIECMKSGVLYSSAAAIDGIIDRIE